MCLFDNLFAVRFVNFIEILAYKLRAEIGGHYYYGVFEVYHTSFVVGESSVVEYLQQDVENVGVSLLYLVEQHYRVWLVPYGFGELTAFVVAYISRRSSHKARRRVFLLIFAHIDTRHQVFVVEEVLSQSLCQFGLAHTCGTQEDKRAYRAFGILQSCT